jgi:hypothetical protein
MSVLYELLKLSAKYHHGWIRQCARRRRLAPRHDGWVNLNPIIDIQVNFFSKFRELFKGNRCAFVQFNVPSCNTCNLMRPHAIPCNQDPKKKKGATTLLCVFPRHLKGGNSVQSRAIWCALMQSRATKIPKRTFFPIFEYAFVPLGMGFTQPSSTRIEESTDLN